VRARGQKLRTVSGSPLIVIIIYVITSSLISLYGKIMYPTSFLKIFYRFSTSKDNQAKNAFLLNPCIETRQGLISKPIS